MRYRFVVAIAAFLGGGCDRQAQQYSKPCSILWEELYQAKAQAFFSEGFEFTPGGGYFYYPRGREILTQEQRNAIETRLRKKLAPLQTQERNLERICQ